MDSVFDYIGLREARPESEKNSTDPRFAAGLYLLKAKMSAQGGRWLGRVLPSVRGEKSVIREIGEGATGKVRTKRLKDTIKNRKELRPASNKDRSMFAR